MKIKKNKLKKLSEKFIRFKIIYKNTRGNDDEEHFKNALEKLNNIKEIFKSKDEENKNILKEIKNHKIDVEIEKYLDEKNTCKEVSLLINFDSYKKDIESIFYFFDYSRSNDDNWNKILCPEYKNISQNNILQYLQELKEKKIYDYEDKSSNNYYLKFFNCL